MKKHINIPVFIPMMGCPFACIYCNQVDISGHSKPDFDKIDDEISKALETTDCAKQEIQIAYFGGSFTGIDRNDMIYLLEIANKYISKGLVHSIRCSTRPDFINEEIVEILKKYNVKTVELGVQSANDEVLAFCKRGHDFKTTEKAANLLVSNGIEFIGQMMVGLPKSSECDEIETAKKIVELKASGARIYPCVVLKNTKLAEITKNGEYKPLTFEESTRRCEEVFEVFVKNNVNVIRIGLQANIDLTSGNDIAYGIYDETVGEKCQSLYFKKKIERELDKINCDGKIVSCYVYPTKISCSTGYKKGNKLEISKKYNLKRLVFVPDANLGEFEIKISISN